METTLRDLWGAPMLRSAWGMSARETEEGRFSGVANVMGVLDSYRSVWMPGCYSAEVVSGFLRSGFFSDGHNWGDMRNEVAMPTRCDASGRTLEIEGKWHTTPYAQDVRTVCLARANDGLEVGLSVGTLIDWGEVAEFSKGSDFWAWAVGRRYDMSLIDPALENYDGYLWAIPNVRQLVEVALTSIPAVPGSIVTQARNNLNALRDGSLAGLPLDTHLDSVLAAVEGALTRVQSLADTRALDNRTLGTERRDQARRLADALNSLANVPSGPDEAVLRDRGRRLLASMKAGF